MRAQGQYGAITMRRVWRGVLTGVSMGILAAMTVAGPADAADKLTIAPPGAWVVPIAVPADDGKGDDAAVKLLLHDQQDDLQPGRITRYLETVFKVQTPQGLPAGAVSFAWNPDIQVATVHKLQIRRGKQVIDVLASGQSFTILRRETNLENAMLDGQLTASIQPEGLQVGDIIDFALSITTIDPAIGGHVEDVGATWNGLPFARAHLSAQWPSSLSMRIQPSGGILQPKLIRKGNLSSIDVAMDNVQPLPLTKGAPARYQYGRLIEMTDAPSWDSIVALMAPLYAKAETLSTNSPVQTEIAKIKAASSDPKTRAEAALALVQDRVRYVFIGMNDGGLVPTDADTTWSRRFGDCKGKTVLLLAILHNLGIEAAPVLVSSALGDGLDKRLPEIALFDHVLVRAVIGGRTYWLDGTRVGDRTLDGIETPAFHWGLPLVSGKAALVAMMPPPYTTPQIDVAIRIDASGGLSLPAPIHIDRIVRGDGAVSANLALANLAGEARDRALRTFWKNLYDFAEPKSVTTNFDPVRRELRLGMDGTTKMDWNDGWYEADHVWVGYKADFGREPGPNKDAPYAVEYPNFTHVTETILLPPRAGHFTIATGSEVDQTVAGMEYHRHARINDNQFVVEESQRSLVPEFPASQAPAAETALRALVKKSVYLGRPNDYRDTSAEVTANLAETPTTADGLVEQGNMLLEAARYDEAIDRFTKAIALDPKNALAFADRGLARIHAGITAGASADLDTAQGLDPRNLVVSHARGLLAEKEGRYRDAIGQLTASLNIEPNDQFALYHRANAYYAVGEDDLALNDAATAISREPFDTDMHLLRANILRKKGDRSGMAREADALIAANRKDTYSLVAAGKIYAAAGHQDDAMRAFDAALAIKPESYIYLNRFSVRSKTDVAGREGDLDDAIRLDPKSQEAIETKAAFLVDHDDWRNAAATLSSFIATKPADPRLLGRRGVVYAKMGDTSLADKDFAAARAVAKTSPELNDLCWTKATAGVALDRALSECDSALALEPGASHILDSRAFVLLRMGRLDDALAEYSKALSKQPRQSASLYGRAIIEERKGNQVAATGDLLAAIKLNPDVQEEFARYGMKMNVRIEDWKPGH